MHEELVNTLLYDAGWLEQGIEQTERDIAEHLKKAADAIEELSMKLHGDEAAIAGMKREIERMVVAGKPRWIPVTERLPEEFQPVWVACKMDGRENWTFDTVYDPYLKCPWGPYYYLEKGEAVVYAWMDRSAPEPPKEEA